MPAGHGAQGEAGGYVILNSYHCSRLNTNTGRLTPQMFEDIFARARTLIEA
jgi:uracil-DNA glycosylase